MAVISGHGGSITGLSTYGVLGVWTCSIEHEFSDIGAYNTGGFAYPWPTFARLTGTATGVLDASGTPRVPFFQSPFAIKLYWTSSKSIEFDGLVSQTGFEINANGEQSLTFSFLSYGQYSLF